MSVFPRLSPNGKSVIAQAPGRYHPCWMDNDRYVFAVGNGPGIQTSAGGSYPWPEPNSLSAGGGLFAADYWGQAGVFGIKDSAGDIAEGGYHSAMSEDGRLVYLTGHGKPTQELRDTEGTIYDSLATLEYPRACIGGLVWSRYDGRLQRTWFAQWQGIKRKVHASGDLAEFHPVAVWTPTGIWIATYTHIDVRVYPLGSTEGYVFPSKNAKAVDAKWDGDGLRVVWNDGANALVERRQDLSAPRVRLDVSPLEIPEIDRRVWCGFFEFVPASVPGNCELSQVSAWEWRLMDGGEKVAVYVSGEPDGNLASLEANIAKVKSQGVPVIGYWPRSLHAGRVPLGADWIGVEAYRLRDESLVDFERRIRTVAQRCGQAALVCQCYTSNALLTSDLTSVVPVYARVARDLRNVIALVAFSGSGRATGLQDHPEVRPSWETLVAGIPGPPQAETPIKVPAIDIMDWKPIDADKTGLLVRFKDQNNPQCGIIEVVLRSGSLHVQWVNASGKDVTTQTRKVI